jgi:hypothetical protein
MSCGSHILWNSFPYARSVCWMYIDIVDGSKQAKNQSTAFPTASKRGCGFGFACRLLITSCLQKMRMLQYSYYEPERPEVALAHLTQCGEGLASSEQHEILMSMKCLGGDPGKRVEALRFWGKFWTMQGCYYVFECRMAERLEQVPPSASNPYMPTMPLRSLADPPSMPHVQTKARCV